MIGYHYTAQQNWERIRTEGLRPYRLRTDIVPDGVPGIWLFTERQRGQSHAGCVLFQIKAKRSLDIVELAVAYDLAQTQRPGWDNYVVRHDGALMDDEGEWLAWYHRGAPATLHWAAIAPAQIQVVGRYRFAEAWTQTEDTLTVGLLEQAQVHKEQA